MLSFKASQTYLHSVKLPRSITTSKKSVIWINTPEKNALTSEKAKLV